MSSFDANHSVSSAYLNRKPLRSAPTLSINRLANGNYGNGDNIVYCDPKLGEVESQVERAIIESDNPLPFNEGEQISLSNTEHGVWLNRDENLSWKGPVPLDQYRINVDQNPHVIVKKPTNKLKYKQEIHVKYLKPPTPKPSELVIVQEPNRQLPPAPPLIIRQAPPRQPTPEPIIIREAPPQIPEPVRRVIHVPGKILPAPARKVIVEKLPCPPPKPQQVIIERWLKPRIPTPRVIVCKPIERQYEEPQCQPCPPCPPCYPQCPPGCQPIQHYDNCLTERNDIVISIFIE